jgi:CRP-like cAMP-binding protein
MSSKLKFEGILPENKNFNLPLANYQAGSYFGDIDFFCNQKQRHFFRTSTMVCDSDCTLYTFNAFDMLEILDDYKQIFFNMKKIALLKEKYYKMLMEKLAHKYDDKFKVVALYNDLKDYFITFHQGLKRKKNLIENQRMEEEREKMELDRFNPGKWKTIDRLMKKDELRNEINDLTSSL